MLRTAILIFRGLGAGFIVMSLFAACEAPKPPMSVADNLSKQHQGKNIDEVVLELGPPASSFVMSNGQKLYEWQMAGGTDASGNAVQCKIRAVSNQQGVVQNISTNDQTTGGAAGNSWCQHALSGNLANIKADNEAAADAADVAVSTAAGVALWSVLN
jgi:hypothetical protein